MILEKQHLNTQTNKKPWYKPPLRSHRFYPHTSMAFTFSCAQTPMLTGWNSVVWLGSRHFVCFPFTDECEWTPDHFTARTHNGQIVAAWGDICHIWQNVYWIRIADCTYNLIYSDSIMQIFLTHCSGLLIYSVIVLFESMYSGQACLFFITLLNRPGRGCIPWH